MRDFKAYVRERLGPTGLPGEQERKVVEELASQLEESYQVLLERGRSDADAWAELEREVPSWTELRLSWIRPYRLTTGRPRAAASCSSWPLTAVMTSVSSGPRAGCAATIVWKRGVVARSGTVPTTSFTGPAPCTSVRIACTLATSLSIWPIPWSRAQC